MVTLKLPIVAANVQTDAALIEACRAGNVDAFGELIARHRDGIYNFVRHTVGHEADAQDLAQETFVRAYHALPRFRLDAPFEPWVYTIAANLCRSHLRKSRRHPQTSLDLEGAIELPEPGADPAQRSEWADETRRLRVAIGALPVDQRMVVVLRHLRGYTYCKSAAILNLPVSTVEHRLRAARLVLRRGME